ncbi:MAG: hypothetical protein JRF72_04015 [Deltaproteobacteria bacterium]|jgi:hypothetical protein|nr:hypothetical protein [Deltaproteobacteria bacterium]
MKSLIAASLLLATLSAGLSIFGLLQKHEPADKEVEVAGALRIVDENGWFVLNDDVHKPKNIDRINVYKGYIIVHFTFTASDIHSFMVSPDESFVFAGFIFGTSVYRSYAAIAVSRIVDGNVEKVDASRIRSNLGNIWIYGKFSIDG